uniref:Small nuclear RNA activating complex, polypeptide 1b n=1 Tax=Gasterosteus aculeatus aculeatus TaxID=481459 RepID=G3P9S9_GASAC|nr:snRNA-activating protein complex subunit 1b [Gasterosteus aculeatus aculeatus]
MEFCVEEVKSDCVELLSRFQTSDSVRFQTFSKIWREMNFSEIFYGTVNHGEQRAFCRLILDTTSSFFMPPYSFQIRVGGLYLLYSLYHSQTSSPPEQIRLALKDWKDVKKFEKDAVDAQHHDVVYILRKLMFQKAFVFAAMPVALSFKKKRKLQRSVPCEQFMERPSRPQELINIDLLEELSNVEEIYGKLKTSVSSALEQSESSLNLVCKSLAPQLRSTVVDFYQWQQRRGVPRKDDGGGEGTSSQQECSNRAQLLASIKSKAFGEATEAPKSRRHRQVEVDSTGNSAGPSSSSGYSRAKKMSLKARTYQNIYVSGDSWNESPETTCIHRLSALDFGPEEKKKMYNKFHW